MGDYGYGKSRWKLGKGPGRPVLSHDDVPLLAPRAKEDLTVPDPRL